MLGHSIKNQKGDLWKNYIKTNTKNVNSVETGRIVIAHFFTALNIKMIRLVREFAQSINLQTI